MLLNNVSVSYTSQRQIDVYRFGLPVTILVPLAAVFFQAFVPLRFPFFLNFDLPLLVVIFFAMARRSPMAGLWSAHRRGYWSPTRLSDPSTDRSLWNRKDSCRLRGIVPGSKAGRGKCRHPVAAYRGFLHHPQSAVFHHCARFGRLGPALELAA